MDLKEKGLLRLLTIPTFTESDYHKFYIILKYIVLRNTLLKLLKQLKIGVEFHYIPIHLSPMGSKLGYNKGVFPLSEDFSSHIERLPRYYELTDSEIDYIIKKINEILQP